MLLIKESLNEEGYCLIFLNMELLIGKFVIYSKVTLVFIFK